MVALALAGRSRLGTHPGAWAPPPCAAVFYAYFAPYSYEQHQALVAEMQCHELVTLEMLVSGAGV